LKAKIRFGILGAFVALAGALGVAGSGNLATPVNAQIPAGLSVTKTCVATTINIQGTTTCTVTVTATAAVSVAEPIVVRVTNGATSGTGANPEHGRVLLLAGTSGAAGLDVDSVAVANPANGLTQSITANCTGATCDFAVGDTITFTEGLQGIVGGPTAESITFGAGVAVALAPTVTVQSATVTATATCNPATVTAGAAPAAAGVSVCRIDFNDNDLFPTVVASGNVVVTVIGPNGVVLAANGTTTGSFACGSTQNSPQSCDFIDVTLNSNTPGVSGNVTLLVNYVSDVPAVDFSNVFTLTNVLAVSALGPTAAFVQPAGLRITCPSTTDAFAPQGLPIVNPTPSQLGGLNIIALGVLPATLICTAVPIDAAGNVLAAVAPGIIEVSTVQGVLIDAAGRITTNLRIDCSAGGALGSGVFGGATGINPNTCTGVSFGVIGQGVGIVEILAEYEPNAIAEAAGIQSRQARANVGFIAPIIVPSLLLSPNPVVVGATGTATVRFNRSANCSAAFGAGSIQGGQVCIDPTTGTPIIFNFGSALNGNVILTIANNAAAVWAESVTPQTPSSLASTGFIATAAQVIRRCGFFATTGIIGGLNQVPSTTGALANFFGGCDTVSATYRGVLPGVTNITATFIPDLPGAFGQATGVTAATASLLGLFGSGSGTFATSQRVLEVVAAPPSGIVQLARGCNNVSPTVTESATAYAARVTPAGALVAIWEHQSATNTFRGFSPLPGAPNDLTGTTRLRPVFVCVSGAAQLDQPPA
jgi:hypothetical protein